MESAICFKHFWTGFDINHNIFTEMIKYYNIKPVYKITMISCFNHGKNLKERFGGGVGEGVGKIVY